MVLVLVLVFLLVLVLPKLLYVQQFEALTDLSVQDFGICKSHRNTAVHADTVVRTTV